MHLGLLNYVMNMVFYVIAESDIESHGTNAVYVESPETSILLGVKTEIDHDAIRQKNNRQLLLYGSKP